MAAFSRLQVLNGILDLGLVPIFYNPDLEVSRQIVSACAAGGARVVEFTNRGDGAPRLFAKLARHIAEADPGLILGVGSVLDAPTAALYIGSGASFVVGPVLNPEVARLCNRRKVAYLPGCGSVSEVSAAEELGVEICKLFPAGEMGGPAFVKALLAPMPWSRVMPTGGVQATEEGITAWIQAGAACLGMGSDLVSKELVARRDFEGISRRVARSIAWVAKARGESVFACVEHVGVYPAEGSSGEAIGEWYRQAFGWKLTPAAGGNRFAGFGRFGWVEGMNEPIGENCHVAVRVRSFEAAVEDLQSRGYELMEQRISPEAKLVYLKDRDPGGNLVHLVWRAQ